jgi:hypothetical protein
LELPAQPVPGRGLEPLRISPPDPKSGASANSATLATPFCNRAQMFSGRSSYSAHYYSTTIYAFESMFRAISVSVPKL